jgi:Tfp pilus assembly protein PilX
MPLERVREAGSSLLVSLILLLLLVMLGSAMLMLSGVESSISHNDLWSEGAFHAAEAGIHAGLAQLAVDPLDSVQPIAETVIVEDFSYRSGGRHDAGPQALGFLGAQPEPGFSAAVGTGYNPSGYAFARYRIEATGSGPRQTRRQVEVSARFGPIPQ